MTANYFQIFGLPLALGRPFTTEEERLGADIRVAIISHSLWEQRGADPNMLGRTVRVNGEPFTVVGVAAKGFTGGEHPRTGGVAAAWRARYVQTEARRRAPSTRARRTS